MNIKPTMKQILYWVLQIFLPLVLYIFILTFRSFPVLFRPASLTLRYGTTYAIAIVGLGSFLILCIKGKLGNISLAAWIAALFGLALNGTWASGSSDGWAAGGLFPWAEAGSYYTNALRLVQGWDITSSAARRPLYPIYLSVGLRLTNGNLMVTLAIETFIIALSTIFIIRETRKHLGALPTAITLTLLFIFMRRFTGITGTESLGYPLSALGFALLLRNVHPIDTKASRFEVLLGIGALALGQFVRPAAMLILPLLALWAGFHFRAGRWISIPITAIGIGVILAAYVMNAATFYTFSGPGMQMNDSWSWSVYGMAVGGKGFYQHDIDFPQCKVISAAECSNLVMQGAIDEITHHPENLAKGILKTYSALFSNSYNNLFSFATFSFADDQRQMQDLITEWILFALFFVGLGTSIVKSRDPLHLLIVLVNIGIFLSVPFAPPTESNRMRLYTVSIFMTILPVSVGLETLMHGLFKLKRLPDWTNNVKRWMLQPDRSTNSQPQNQSTLKWLSLGFVIYVIVFPYSINLTVKIKPASARTLDCPAGQIAAVIDYTPGTALRIDPEKDFFLDWVPHLHEGRFDKGLHASGSQWVLDEFYNLETPVVLIETLDLVNGGAVWVPLRPDQLASGYGRFGICGTAGDTEGITFIYPNQVEILENR
jgi:hypothetical protein